MSTEKLCSRVFPRNSQRPGVGLLEPRVHLVDEAFDHLDGGMPRHLADEARVEEEPAHREHHLPVDVVLDVLERLVSDPHRPVSVEPGEVLEHTLSAFESPLIRYAGCSTPSRSSHRLRRYSRKRSISSECPSRSSAFSVKYASRSQQKR